MHGAHLTDAASTNHLPDGVLWYKVQLSATGGAVQKAPCKRRERPVKAASSKL
jgi:hypothetical protein